MAEEKSSPLRQASKKDDEVLSKVIRPEGEMEIPIGEDDVMKKVYWVRTGFDSRVFYHAYFKKKLQEAIDMDVITRSHVNKAPTGIVDGKNSAFSIEPHSIVEGTLKVFRGSTLCNSDEYSYNSDLRVLFFYKPPISKVIVAYDYYDQEIYDELYNNAIACILVYFSARELGNHNKKVFKSPDEVGTLNQIRINDILGKYMDILKVKDTNLKNLPTSPRLEAGSDLQSDTDLTPLEEQSGETQEN